MTLKQKEAIDKYKHELTSNTKAYLRITLVINAFFIGVILGVKNHLVIDIDFINIITAVCIGCMCVLMMLLFYLENE